jgi:hypothetical protein
MKYVSTRGQAPSLDFQGVTLAGLASDGGLYVPETWPQFTADEISGMAGLPYAQLAQKIMLPFVGDCLTPERLLELCEKAYGRFAHAAVSNAFDRVSTDWKPRSMQHLKYFEEPGYCAASSRGLTSRSTPEISILRDFPDSNISSPRSIRFGPPVRTTTASVAVIAAGCAFNRCVIHCFVMTTSYPMRVLTDTGSTPAPLFVSAIIFFASLGFSINFAPAPIFSTLLSGHPILISIPSKPSFAISFAHS